VGIATSSAALSRAVALVVGVAALALPAEEPAGARTSLLSVDRLPGAESCVAVAVEEWFLAQRELLSRARSGSSNAAF
jgi:hypothetical protein